MVGVEVVSALAGLKVPTEDFQRSDKLVTLQRDGPRLMGFARARGGVLQRLELCDHHGVSDKCVAALETFNIERLALAEEVFVSKNKRCLLKSIAPCWDFQHKHWRSDICKVHCDAGREELRGVCESKNLNGTLCDASLVLGFDGMTIEAKQPVCFPEECSGSGDVAAMQSCLAERTCDQVPDKLLPSCRAEFSCGGSGVLATVFATSLVLAALMFACGAGAWFARRKGWGGACVKSRKEPGSVHHGIDDDGSSSNQGNGEANRVPLLVHGDHHQSFMVVSGTPREINRELLEASESATTPDIQFGSSVDGADKLANGGTGHVMHRSRSGSGHGVSPGTSVSETSPMSMPMPLQASIFGTEEDERQGAAPRFKLNDDLESHVLEGIRQRLSRQSNSRDSVGDLHIKESSLVWHNLFYKRDGVHILRGLTGFVKPGTTVALVGAPDSGGTTLLKVLAGRATGGTRWGDILIDGAPPDVKSSHRKIGYIPKEDFNLPTLTVRETLAFSLALRSDRNYTQKLRDDRIDACLQLLGLKHVAETLVGDELIRGCSGGEKRRVSIGVEAIVGRRFQLMDCVTNGLDSAAAYQVIKTNRVLADVGLTCSVATVRQPSPELLSLFHQVYLISRGSCLYFGPTSQVEGYFSNLGYARPLTKAVPDFLEELTGDASGFFRPELVGGAAAAAVSVGVVSGDVLTTQHTSQGAVIGLGMKRVASTLRTGLADAYKHSESYEHLGRTIWEELDRTPAYRQAVAEQHVFAHELDEDEQSLFERARRACSARWAKILHNDAFDSSLSAQIKVCLGRQMKISTRSPTMRAKMYRAIFQGFLLGTMFRSLDLDQRDARNRYGLLFIVITSVCMGAMAIIPQLFNQRIIFYHQRSSGYFRSLAYLLAVDVCEIPLFFCEAFLFSIILYPLAGLQGGVWSEHFMYFFLTHTSMNFASFSLCLLGAMAAPTAVVATATVPTVLSIMILISGYLVRADKLPFPSISDLSMITRPLKGLVLNEMEGLVFKCDPDELVPPLDYLNATVPPPNGFWGKDYQTCPMASGHLSLYMYGYEQGEQDKWVLFWQNTCFIIIYQVLIVLVLATMDYAPDSSDSAVTAMQARERMRRLELRAAARANNARLDGDMHEREEELHMEQLARERGRESYHTSSASFSSERSGPSASAAALAACYAEDDPETSSSGSGSGEGLGAGSVEFVNLSYTVHMSNGPCRTKTDKQLLFGVNGHVAGRILALMGPSGSGKSTLLDVLAARKTGGTPTFDTLLFNGRPRDECFARIAGYVEQMDSHLPTQTVREAIWTSAVLRLPAQVSMDERKRRVAEVIDCLTLRPFAREQIGTPEEGGVSPEVRKKVTIGVELVFDSDILFLDEPTTGLDSRSALHIMQAIRRTCSKKSTICTIHQPSAEVFALFDWMLLLQTGGKVCYFGPVIDMRGYFQDNGFGVCGADRNPADFALTCTNVTVGGQDAASIFESSAMKRRMDVLAPSKGSAAAVGKDASFVSPFAASVWTQFEYQVYTQFNYHWRDTRLLFTRAITGAMFGIIIGTLFWQMDSSQASAQSRIGLIFISLIYCGYTAIQTIPKSIDQRPVRFREHGSNYYRMWVHYLAMFLAEVPFLVMQISCYVLVFYFMVGLRGGHHFSYFYGVMMLHALTTFGFSSFVSMVAPNSSVATIVNTVANGTMTLLSGFLLPFDSIPSFWRMFYYASFYRHPLGALVSNEILDAHFNCGKYNNESAVPIFVGGLNETTPPPPYGMGVWNETCKNLITQDYMAALEDPWCFKYYCPIETGNFLLDRFSFPETTQDMNHALASLAVFCLAFRVLAFIGISTVNHVNR